MSYYYFAATLPTLSFGEPPDVSADRFVELCEEQLSPRDAAEVRALMAPGLPTGTRGFTRAWRGKEIQLRNAIVRARAARLQVDPAPFLVKEDTFDAAVERTVAEAFEKKTPLDREMTLDRFRWRAIETLAGFDMFTSRAMLAYALKVKLCERWRHIDRERGEQQADTVINQPVGQEPEPRNDTEQT